MKNGNASTERTLTLDEVNRCRDDRERYPGFGTSKTCTEWARKLGIRREDFWYHLHKDALTVEEIFTEYGQPRGRKERTDTHRVKTREAVWLILLDSGYLVDEADVLVEYGNNTELLVSLYGAPLGVYNYVTDTLKLPSGQGLKLREPLVECQRIRKDKNGRWDLHPETQRDLVMLALSQCPGEPSEDEYANL